MNVLFICGDRNWLDYDQVHTDVFIISPDLVIIGGARGADEQGRKAAAKCQINHEVYPAKWVRFGRAAGPIRNKEMLARLVQLRDEGADIQALAYHDKIEESKGTANMVALLESEGIDTEVITHGK